MKLFKIQHVNRTMGYFDYTHSMLGGFLSSANVAF